ncbi:MAG: hypothetical protein D3922_12570 [Candidatus Electrothrix sp. AR1]|nr:hypothetical protein [Candidatus Electrothrix sp. AR1]
MPFFSDLHVDIKGQNGIKMSAVSVPVHLEARENLLDNTWWREDGLKERNLKNDAAVLDCYENN